MKGYNRIAAGLWVFFAGLLLSGSLSVAADSGASSTVKSTSERMLSALESQRSAIRSNPTRIYGLVDRILIPKFDFDLITKAAVGKGNWSKATPAQRKALTDGFQQVLIRTYAKALLSYSGEDIRYLPERPGRSGTVLVPTEVSEAGAKPIRIDYSLHNRSGSWKVYDVKIDNVSLVKNYRGSFNSQIRKEGIDGLIKRLDEKNAKGQG
jgi:phospholipid transport system substrate-binding protein